MKCGDVKMLSVNEKQDIAEVLSQIKVVDKISCRDDTIYAWICENDVRGIWAEIIYKIGWTFKDRYRLSSDFSVQVLCKNEFTDGTEEVLWERRMNGGVE